MTSSSGLTSNEHIQTARVADGGKNTKTKTPGIRSAGTKGGSAGTKGVWLALRGIWLTLKAESQG